MSHLYKRYTIDQLKEEEEMLEAKLEEAKAENQTKHILVNQRKIEIVQSFMIDRQLFEVGDYFKLKDNPDDLFEIDELVGVIAWGYYVNPETHKKIDSSNRVAKLLILLGDKKEF